MTLTTSTFLRVQMLTHSRIDPVTIWDPLWTGFGPLCRSFLTVFGIFLDLFLELGFESFLNFFLTFFARGCSEIQRNTETERERERERDCSGIALASAQGIALEQSFDNIQTVAPGIGLKNLSKVKQRKVWTAKYCNPRASLSRPPQVMWPLGASAGYGRTWRSTPPPSTHTVNCRVG